MTSTTELLTTAALTVAAIAAARSTWSPCGLSMLSTITPLAESGRGHRWAATATWFVTGSVLGGATTGVVIAGVAWVIGAVGLPDSATATLACLATLAAAASDIAWSPQSPPALRRLRLPIHGRQVNERWLDGLRPWVYGTGFGWQIGSGLATYVKTAGVYLMLALAALTGRPLVALVVGLVFGLVRGLAVFVGHTITSPAALAEFHRRFMRLEPVVLAWTIAVEILVGIVLGWAVTPALGALAAAVAVALAATVFIAARSRRSTAPAPAPAPAPPSSQQ